MNVVMLMSLDSIFVNSDKEYYLQILLEECKHAIKNKKIVIFLSESDEFYHESDE